MNQVNIWAVLVAAVSGFLLGGVWFSYRVFGRLWNREAGRGREAFQPDPARVFGLSFLFALASVAVFAYWLGPEPPLGVAILKAAVASACFVAASLGITCQFANVSLLMWLIDGGYHVARFLLVGLVFGLWH